MEESHASPDPMTEPSALAVAPHDSGLAVSGELDISTWELASESLSKALAEAEPGRDITLDLGGLSFVDAQGAHLITSAADRLRPPARLVLRGAPPGLLRIVKILGYDRHASLVIEERQGNGAG